MNSNGGRNESNISIPESYIEMPSQKALERPLS
jgi:hypothetical protein